MDVRNRKPQASGKSARSQHGKDGRVPTGRRIKAAYGHFAETTTFGGAIHTFISPHWIWRAVWVLVVLFLIGATVWNTHAVIKDYLGFPVTTSIDVADKPSIPFPTVTVCNRNPVSCSKIAYAYVQYPEELNDLMYYSNCVKTLLVDPLRGQVLFDNVSVSKQQGVLAWRSRVEERAKTIVNSRNSSAYTNILGIDPSQLASDGPCKQFLTSDSTSPPFENFVYSLITECEARLSNAFLFPKLRKPSAAAVSTNGTKNGTKAAVKAMALMSEGSAVHAAGASSQIVAPEYDAVVVDGTAGVIKDQTGMRLVESDAVYYYETEEEGASTTPSSDEEDMSTTEGTDGGDIAQETAAEMTSEPLADDIHEIENFISELSSIAKNRSKLHLSKALLEDYDQFILSCNYFGRNCLNESEFVVDFVPDYGSCFSFNSAFGKYGGRNNDSGTRSAFLTGSLYGLTMELWVDEEEYLPSAAASGAGARVSLTVPGTRPDPVDSGLFVKPATEAEFAYKVLQVSRQPNPYISQCYGSWKQTPYQPLSYIHALNMTEEVEVYTYSECTLMSTTTSIAKDCKCIDPHKTRPFLVNGDEITGKYDVCDISSKEQETCTLKTLLRMQADSDYGCHLPCSDTQFITSTSTARWPTKSYLGLLMGKYRKKNWFKNWLEMRGYSTSDPVDYSVMSNNLVKINVFAQTMTVETISEQAKYDFSQALSALGGALGLYTGFCGITVFEIIELAIILTFAVGGYAHRKIEDGGDIGDSSDSSDDETRPRGEKDGGSHKTRSARNQGMGKEEVASSWHKKGSKAWPEGAPEHVKAWMDPPKAGVGFRDDLGLYMPQPDPVSHVPHN